MNAYGYPESCIGFRSQSSRGGDDFWPAPGGVVESPAATRHNDTCPRFAGDGVCVARTVRGFQSGGARLDVSSYVLLVGWHPADLLAGSTDKVRVRRAQVLARLPVLDLLRSGANLRGANLRGASLYDANLRGANLRGADLRDANLRGADLRGADLRDANLRGADLHDANLRGANLRGADLRGADLRGADLSGAYRETANGGTER